MLIVFLIAAALFVLLLSGTIQQERIRLWELWQIELAEKRKAEIAAQRALAAKRIKEVLRQRREGGDIDVRGEVSAAMADARRNMKAIADTGPVAVGQAQTPAPAPEAEAAGVSS